MDISVRRLNHRLALQLPKELPLGLVFVMGVVSSVNKTPIDGDGNGRIRKIEFELVEDNYVLRCVLTQSRNNPTTVWEGETVRVGGHLMFDPHQANYFLMTHDVELVIAEEEIEPLFSDDSLALVHEQQALADALAGVKRRSQAVVQLESAELPIWVQKIAPLEVREELGIEVDDTNELDSDATNLLIGSDSDDVVLSEEMVSDFAAAMEGEDDVVITTDLLANYVGDDAQAFGSAVVDVPQKNGGVEKTSTNAIPQVVSPQSIQKDMHETDWLVILLIITFVLMTLVFIVATITLVLR